MFIIRNPTIRTFWTLLMALALVVGAGAVALAGDSERTFVPADDTAAHSEEAALIADKAEARVARAASIAQGDAVPDAGAFDVADAKFRFVAGVPASLLATLAGMPETGMGWGCVTRLGLAPGAELAGLVGGGPTVYIVEAGEVALQSDGSARIARAGAGSLQAQQFVLRGDEVPLGIGDRVVVNAGVSYGLRNAGTTDATLLATAILPSSAMEAPAFNNAGLTPETPLSVAMFLPGPDQVEAPSWPKGITIKPIAAQEIGIGGAVATADEVQTAAPSGWNSPTMGVEP